MKKTYLVTFRIDEQEQEKLKSDANETGISVSEYIRKRINEKPIVKVYQPRELLRHINGIGNNINQIAKHANMNAAVNPYDIQQIKKDISNLKWQIYKFIGESDVLCQ